MKTWIITIASVLVICLLLGALCFAEFGSFNFVRVGLALSKTIGGEGIYQIADSPERVWLVGTLGGLDAFRAYLESEGWTLRMDDQMGALIPVEKDGLRDYVLWSVNAMSHKFTWQTAGDPAQGSAPAVLHYAETAAESLYLYPTQDTAVTVTPGSEPAFSYPAWKNGLHLTAHPDGTFTAENGLVYHRLFWEAPASEGFAMEEGFCAAGSDTAAFLEDALTQLGLTRREINDFLLFWLPRMQQSSWNLICFHTDGGADLSPAPDTFLRITMVWKALDEPVDIPAQTLTVPDRTGFTAVLLGGAEVE